MANEKIKLKAKANQLGISGYRTMSEDALRAAITKAEGKSAAPAKGKSTVAKGKSTASAAPAKGKSTGQKSSSAKTTAAKGKASRAASTTKGKKTTTVSKGKATAKKKATPAKAPRQSRKNVPARVDIDNSAIDWKAESNVGRTGKRAEVMSALRKYKGNKAKVFDLLQPKAKSYYKGKSKHDAERTLVWLIGRVAFDFVMSTGQHTPGQRAGYGESTNPVDVRRREARAASAPAKTKTKAAPAKGRTATKKTTAKRGTAKRATAKGKGRTRR